MRKYFIWLAAIALLVTTASAAYAIDFKMTGFYRVRGITADDGDRNSKTHDSQQDNDRLFRPRFTVTSDDKKVMAIYEFDVGGIKKHEFDVDGKSKDGSFEVVSDWGGDKPFATVNRYLVDFAVPGTTLRFRMGRSDWTSPDREIFDSFGNNRRTGFGLYGRLSGPVSLSAFTFKYAEGGTESTDADAYYVALGLKAAPSITITPWIGYDRKNGGDSSEAGYDLAYYAINAKAKFGIADIDASIVLNDGEINYSRDNSLPDVELDGWAALVRTWFTFGKLKLGYAGTFISGDDDRTSGTGVLGQQPDNELSRFVFPQLNKAGQLLGPQLITRRRYHAIGVIGDSSPNSGGGGAASNGVNTHELLVQYQATKDLTLSGQIGFANSHSQRADIDVNLNGDTSEAGDSTYDSSTEIGTEVDVHFSYNIYPGLILKGTYSYLWAGDYGVEETSGGVASASRGKDDTWAAHIGLRYLF
jgi:hypothetical protein